jgi:hypothetical protein
MTAAAESFNQVRAAFMRRASAPNVTPFALKLAYVLAFKYMNRESRTAFVAQDTLAHDLNVTERHVRRMLDILQPLGLVVVLGHGPNRASTYWIDPDKAEKRTTESGYKRTTESASEPNTGLQAHDNRTPGDTNTGLQSPPYLTKRTKKGTKKRKKDSLPPVASLAGKKGRKSPAAGRSKPQAKPDRDAETADEFARFWAVYPRHDAEQPARKEFERAVEDTDPEIIIAGAQRYALAEQMRLARPGQRPQHTAMAKNWLHDRRWNDPPPPGEVIDQTGNVIAIAAVGPRKTETWMETAERRQRERAAGLRP